MKLLSPIDAIFPAPVDLADAYAIAALQSGTASDEQQKRALRWIIYAAARTYDVSYRPGSERETCFAEGRRFVGLEIIRVLDPATIDRLKLKKPNAL